MARRPDYGIDAPVRVRRLVVTSLLGAAVAAGGAFVGLTLVVVAIAALVAVAGGAAAVACLATSRIGKLREREHLLDLAELVGDEVLLDVGCGRGLLVVGAAKRLPAGEAVGVDKWSRKDLSSNTPAGPLHNARVEGVKVQIETGDACDLPFDDDTFDVVVSSNVLHNLDGPGTRRRAIREIDRVLKPAGRLVLCDISHTDEYVAALRGAGWRRVERSDLVFRLFPPFRYVVGAKLEVRTTN